jgi:hypothetical protein
VSRGTRANFVTAVPQTRATKGPDLGLPQVPTRQRQEDRVAEDDDDQREPTDQEQRVGGRCRGARDGRSRAPRGPSGSRRRRFLLGGLLRRASVDLTPAGGLRSRRRRDHRGSDDRRSRRHGNRRLRLWRGRRWLNRLRLCLDGRRGRRRRRRRLPRGRLRSRARHWLRFGRGRARFWRGLRGRSLGGRRDGGAQRSAAEYDDN